jgi:hypothetical protein
MMEQVARRFQATLSVSSFHRNWPGYRCWDWLSKQRASSEFGTAREQERANPHMRRECSPLQNGGLPTNWETTEYVEKGAGRLKVLWGF